MTLFHIKMQVRVWPWFSFTLFFLKCESSTAQLVRIAWSLPTEESQKETTVTQLLWFHQKNMTSSGITTNKVNLLFPLNLKKHCTKLWMVSDFHYNMRFKKITMTTSAMFISLFQSKNFHLYSKTNKGCTVYDCSQHCFCLINVPSLPLEILSLLGNCLLQTHYSMRCCQSQDSMLKQSP